MEQQQRKDSTDPCQKRQEPLVSVCIPAYNNRAYIEATMWSVLAQDYRNLELIVVDDHSSDDTAAIVERIADKDPRVRLVRNEENLGMTGNWNKCLSLCRGDYVKLICADDLLVPKALRLEVEAMQAHPGVNLVESDTQLINNENRPSMRYHRYPGSGVKDGKRIAKSSLIWKNFFGAPCNNLMRRSVLEKVGTFDPDLLYILDFDFWIRIACTGEVYIIHECLNQFRVRNDSNTGKLIGKQKKLYEEEHRRLMEKHAKGGILKISRFEISFSIWFRKVRNLATYGYLKIFAK